MAQISRSLLPALRARRLILFIGFGKENVRRERSRDNTGGAHKAERSTGRARPARLTPYDLYMFSSETPNFRLDDRKSRHPWTPG